MGGLIWGCRHQAEAAYDCMYYHARHSALLCDRYEPVTRHMGTRINNVWACLTYLQDYHQQLLKVVMTYTHACTHTYSNTYTELRMHTHIFN